MNKTIQVLKYLVADYLAAFIAWTLFFIYRKYSFNPNISDFQHDIFFDKKLYLGLIIIPICWIVFYFILGNYKRIFRKSRIKELAQTFVASFIGVIVIFFAIILDDFVKSNRDFYWFILSLLLLHFFFTALFRFALTSITAHKIHNKTLGFNTLIIGGNGKATQMFLEMEKEFTTSGNKFVGFVNVKDANEFQLSMYLKHLGHFKDAKQIILEHKIEEVIIAIDPSEHKSIDLIINSLDRSDVIIKVIPEMHDILLGSVKMTAIFQAPLILIFPEIMPHWQTVLKRVMDIGISILAIIILLPVFIFTAIGVWSTSKGPVFYSHKRIGINGKPFTMHKFRSMFMNAENSVPQLSSKNDPRITPFGSFLRKFRLDELPQFYTVLIGDMSLVGYRPERQYFIDQIVEVAPHYNMLLKIKPGITSWGQVKYGYAENVDQMVQRLKYDILYLENMSIAVDIKILFYTGLIVVMGRGK